ncbi:MAG: hypothetical protein GZ090_16215 [Oxalobacteraceae bacterium]|nr:hypothetical protein [Oxalobacteraceae bacterium]
MEREVLEQPIPNPIPPESSSGSSGTGTPASNDRDNFERISSPQSSDGTASLTLSTTGSRLPSSDTPSTPRSEPEPTGLLIQDLPWAQSSSDVNRRSNSGELTDKLTKMMDLRLSDDSKPADELPTMTRTTEAGPSGLRAIPEETASQQSASSSTPGGGTGDTASRALPIPISHGTQPASDATNSPTLGERITAAMAHVVDCRGRVSNALQPPSIAQIAKSRSDRQTQEAFAAIREVDSYRDRLDNQLEALQTRLQFLEQRNTSPSQDISSTDLEAELTQIRQSADEAFAAAQQCKETIITSLNTAPGPESESESATPQRAAAVPTTSQLPQPGTSAFQGFAVHGPISSLDMRLGDKPAAPKTSEITSLRSSDSFTFPVVPQPETVPASPMDSKVHLFFSMKNELARTESRISQFIDSVAPDDNNASYRNTVFAIQRLQFKMERLRQEPPDTSNEGLALTARKIHAICDETQSLVKQAKATIATELKVWEQSRQKMLNRGRLRSVIQKTYDQALGKWEGEPKHIKKLAANPIHAANQFTAMTKLLALLNDLEDPPTKPPSPHPAARPAMRPQLLGRRTTAGRVSLADQSQRPIGLHAVLAERSAAERSASQASGSQPSGTNLATSIARQQD